MSLASSPHGLAKGLSRLTQVALAFVALYVSYAAAELPTNIDLKKDFGILECFHMEQDIGGLV